MPEGIEAGSPRATEGLISEKIFASDGVDVSIVRHRHSITYVKLGMATFLVTVGFGLAVFVLLNLFNNAGLEKLRDNAWTMVTVIVSSALGYLYGSRDRE